MTDYAVTTDLGARLDAERAALLDVLSGLDGDGWATPSLCAGWTVREVVVHVLMPYELDAERFGALMAAAEFSFDRMADGYARADTRSPAELTGALRDSAGKVFNVPGSPPEAELSHLLIHAHDAYRPLGVASPSDPGSVGVVLDLATGPEGQRAMPAGLLDGLALRATDSGWRYGEGAEVSGPGPSLLLAIFGRADALGDLDGEGVATLAARRPS